MQAGLLTFPESQYVKVDGVGCSVRKAHGHGQMFQFEAFTIPELQT